MSSTTIQWGTPETSHIALRVTSDTQANNNVIGGILNPSGYLYASCDFNTRFYVAPSGNGSVDLYLVPAIDGNNYTTGDNIIVPPNTCFVGSLPIYQNANSGMIISLLNIPISPLLVKPLIRNSTSSTIPANSGVLTFRLYKQQIITS
jgi:hypothetical protein